MEDLLPLGILASQRQRLPLLCLHYSSQGQYGSTTISFIIIWRSFLLARGGSLTQGLSCIPTPSVFRSVTTAAHRPCIRNLKAFGVAGISPDILLLLKTQDMVSGIMLTVEKLIKDLKSKEFPEARAYLRILGEELGFVSLRDLQLLGRLLLNGARTLQGIPQMVSRPSQVMRLARALLRSPGFP